MASAQGSLDYPLLAKQMRQISQPVGGVHKEDILNISADAGGTDDEDLSYMAWVAFRKAAESRKDSTQGLRPQPKRKGSKPNEQDRNGFNRRTGGRNRCCSCCSEFHLLPLRRPNSSSAANVPRELVPLRRTPLPRHRRIMCRDPRFHLLLWILPPVCVVNPHPPRKKWRVPLNRLSPPPWILASNWFACGMTVPLFWILAPQRIWRASVG